MLPQQRLRCGLRGVSPDHNDERSRRFDVRTDCLGLIIQALAFTAAGRAEVGQGLGAEACLASPASEASPQAPCYSR